MTEDPIRVRVDRGRDELANGKLGAAAGTLGDVIGSTHDPALLSEMRELASEGLERSGRFGKGAWKKLIGQIDEELAES